MNYKELADLIFPNVKCIEYYEEKYPIRDLKPGAMVTRFAPSPTGFMHIGGLFGSTIDRKLAKQTDGVFILRIEDTDQKREIENGISQIVSALQNFNLMPDEGRISEKEEIGNYGPYVQSERKDIYESYAKYLLEKGRAYPCFATQDELEEMRSQQERAKVRPGYYGVWAKYRELPLEEAANKIKDGVPYIIRFKSMGNEENKVKHNDVIKGVIEFPENDQDVVIIKSDGLPTYHFAHLIDDHLMRVTHVIRADEWVSSIPLHLELYKALDFRLPKFAHTAAILKDDNGAKRKISKRKDPEAAVNYYHEQGIPDEAVTEYLLNIANSSFEGWRRANPEKSIDEFELSLNKMSVSGAVFDLIKLLDISKNIISTYSAEKVYDESYKWAKEYDEELVRLLNNKDYSLEVLGIERNNSIKPRKDIAKWSDIKENIIYMYDEEFINVNYEYAKVTDKDEIKLILGKYINDYYNEEDDKQTWFNKIKDLAEGLGYSREVKDWKKTPENWPKGHVGDVSTVLRVALTGRQNTPDLYEIMAVLGKSRMEKRFKMQIQ